MGDHGPRIHLDAEVADIEEATGALVALGASAGPRYRDWQVMTSPGGLPFCLVDRRPPSRPAAVTWPSGHRTRLMQVCIDSPASRHDAEVAFWRAASG